MVLRMSRAGIGGTWNPDTVQFRAAIPPTGERRDAYRSTWQTRRLRHPALGDLWPQISSGLFQGEPPQFQPGYTCGAGWNACFAYGQTGHRLTNCAK